MAVAWANPGIVQLPGDQEKLCLTCHSPRAPPTDTTQVHTGRYDLMQAGAPCADCHGDTQDPNGEETHNAANANHPDATEAAAMGKDILTCDSCHYQHDILQELQTGQVTGPPANATSQASLVGVPLTMWASMIGAGVSLITGVSVIGVLFSARRRSAVKVGN